MGCKELEGGYRQLFCCTMSDTRVVQDLHPIVRKRGGGIQRRGYILSLDFCCNKLFQGSSILYLEYLNCKYHKYELGEGYYVVCMPSDANGSSKDFLVNSNGLSFYRGLRPAADI